MKRKLLKLSIGLILLVLILVYFFVGRPFLESNVQVNAQNDVLYIPTGSSYEDVLEILTQNKILKNPSYFDNVASLLKYKKDKVKGGRYKIENGWTSIQLVKKIRSGSQDPLGIVINNIRTIHDLAGNAAQFLESDSLTFLTYLTSPEVIKEAGLNQDNFLTLFIPNTYEMFWTTTPEKFVQRMKREHEKFWTAEKIEKLKSHNLSVTEAYIVASIVEKESNYNPERPAIARVYLNRLKLGMKLQADPTVVFATGLFDLRRVLYSHLEIDSPYNTYKYDGIPPGPICMPSISSLNAVINAENHDYIFFCAKADNSGQHAFASTLTEHNRNAAAFANWMNQNNIR